MKFTNLHRKKGKVHMAKLLRLVDDYQEGKIDSYTVYRALDVALISHDIDSEQYMNLMDMIDD